MADNKLTTKEVKALTKPGHHSDGAGLYLRIAENRRSWMFRYKKAGKTHWVGLGAEADFTLAEARAGALGCRKQLKAGGDPLQARAANKAAALTEAGRTFRAAAELYIAGRKSTWKSEKHAGQWSATLEAYAYPTLGKKAVGDITVHDIYAVLEPIWKVLPETASRVRGRIEKVIAYASAHKWFAGDNPAGLKGGIGILLPARKRSSVVHHAALPADAMPAVMATLAGSKGMGALCLRFCILTAARSGEARGALWNEIDMNAATWTIPAERMKAGKLHRVPLSSAAMTIIRDLDKLTHSAGGLVFPGGRVGSPLSDVALNKALRIASEAESTVHGARSTFRDWLAEETDYPGVLAEVALAHGNKDKTEAAYQRGDLLEKRRTMMEAWSVFLTKQPSAEVEPDSQCAAA